jgi:hypothetical protein
MYVDSSGETCMRLRESAPDLPRAVLFETHR